MEIDSIPDQDIITALGPLCLGSRLKRLGERMQAGVSAVLAERGHGVQPAQLPILMALVERGPATIGALGERVGISQPGVSRALIALEAAGLVASSSEGRDKRQRLIAPTDKGQMLMDRLRTTLFPAVQAAVEALCGEASNDFIGELARIEEGMARAPLDRRIREASVEGAHHG